ncbi:MAG: RlmE family RNA methyltransferase [Burkholderiales bacterium]
MKATKTSKGWIREHINDLFVQRAKREGYRSRAAYKLMEIDTRDKLIKPGMTVVDLGATPGGWSQVSAERMKGNGRVIAIDLLDMVPPPGVTFLQADFASNEGLAALKTLLMSQPVDLVLSDMAPNISGIPLSDQARSMALCELALEFARDHLKPGGSFLVKVFQGEGFAEFYKEMLKEFTVVATRKPDASRDRSNEVYLLGKGKKAVLAKLP